MKHRTYPSYFIYGALALYLFLYVVPGFLGILYSFTDWSSYSREINFVGLENFKAVFSSDERYLFYIANTLRFTVITIVCKTVFALILAIALSEGVRFMHFHRAVLFLPSVLSMLITGLVFRSILNPGTGLLNHFLDAIGLGILKRHWLTDLGLALYSVMAVDIWKGTGYIMTILLAGILSIPKVYYEAAVIDGASSWAKFHFITFPLLMPAITVSTVLNLLHGLKAFDVVYVLTNGGPGYATEVLYTAVFKEFSLGKYGLGTAISSVLFIFMVAVGYFVIRLMTREEVQE